MKKLKVDAIKNGTVIDHILAGKALKVLDIIKLKESDIVMVGINLTSKKIGRKDIIKIENRELSPNEVNSIALVAPMASIAIIRDFEVVTKNIVRIPDIIEGLITCPNPKCISNWERLDTCFNVDFKEPIKVQCCYCERSFGVDEVRIGK